MKNNFSERIIANPEICHGEPCIKGTRILVSVILDCLAEGMSVDEILTEYPQLSGEDVAAVLGYAAWTVKNEENIPLEAEA